MRLRALSHYNGDKETRFGDCILLYDDDNLTMYDCGHTMHAETVEKFLEEQTRIKTINIVISHNDSDHTDGVITFLEYLKDKDYDVTIYTSLYLKSLTKVMEALNDGRRKKRKTADIILQIFDSIAKIVEFAEECGFNVINSVPDTIVSGGKIVGPTENEFVDVVVKAIEEDGKGNVGGETVKNAASVQFKCTLEDGKTILLCGDASPEFMHNLDNYDIIQLPHHGQLKDAEVIFDKIEDNYVKDYLISDNTGTGSTSGGSDDLVKWMQDELFSPAYNTKNGVVEIPNCRPNINSGGNSKGVRLGDLDCKL